MEAFIGKTNFLIFILIFPNSIFVCAKELLQDVSCNVTSHYADGQTSYEIKCQKNSDSNEGRIQCCAILNEHGLSSEWGSRCGARDERLFNVIDLNWMPEPTSTTCALTIVLKGNEGKNFSTQVIWFCFAKKEKEN